MLITDRTADQNVRSVPEADIADIRIRSKFLLPVIKSKLLSEKPLLTG